MDRYPYSTYMLSGTPRVLLLCTRKYHCDAPTQMGVIVEETDQDHQDQEKHHHREDQQMQVYYLINFCYWNENLRLVFAVCPLPKISNKMLCEDHFDQLPTTIWISFFFKKKHVIKHITLLPNDSLYKLNFRGDGRFKVPPHVTGSYANNNRYVPNSLNNSGTCHSHTANPYN